jgi:hypothetical protein
MSEEAELIRALAEDLALEILASYTSADLRMPILAAWERQPFTSRNTQADQDQHFRNLSLKCRVPPEATQAAQGLHLDRAFHGTAYN